MCRDNGGMIDAQAKRTQAKMLYCHLGKSLTEIASELDVPINTVRSWHRRGGWEESASLQQCNQSLTDRYNYLIQLPEKSEADLREIRVLGGEIRRNLITLKKLENYQYDGKPTTDKDFNPKLSKRGRKSHAEKNFLTQEQVELLEAEFLKRLYPHQHFWYQNIHHRIRNIMKSRQIGATDYFSHEALVDGILHGRNKNFLSASRAQALLFRSYIVAFVYRVTGVELKGGGGTEPMVIRTEEHSHIEFRFLSTNSNSAQGPHGDVIIDEYFWIRDFAKLRRVASAMATHDHWRLVYISTPSTVNHQAYPFWSGEHFNKGRKKENHITLDISHAALKHGRLCEDGQWRQVVTLQDACDQGFDLATPEKLQAEYPLDEYRQLFECEFIDDSQAVFRFEMLQKCLVDVLAIDNQENRVRWLDYDPDAARPLGNIPVWIGYDPSRTTDAAAIVVVAPPLEPKGRFRVIERLRVFGKTFQAQAEMIKSLLGKYNVTELAMDVTGIGLGVFELITKGDSNTPPIFPRAKPIHYSPESKTALVMKGLDVVEAKRLEMDTSAVDMVKALMSIYRTTTDNGTVTYKARRTDTTGHADEAFALLHALSFEPLTGEKRKMTVRTSKARRARKQQEAMLGMGGGAVALFRPHAMPLHTNLYRTAANDDRYSLAA